MTEGSFSRAVAELLAEPRTMPLGRGEPNGAARARLAALTPADFPQASDRDAALAAIAGLWLYHDFWDEAHEVAQDLHTPEGSFWHGIQHRREPDAWNAKYWFRRVGRHPVVERLRQQAAGYTTPEEFVDLCERVRGTGSAEERAAEATQALEWRLMFEHCGG